MKKQNIFYTRFGLFFIEVTGSPLQIKANKQTNNNYNKNDNVPRQKKKKKKNITSNICFFFQARSRAPSIIFIDEIDAISTNRASAEQDHNRELKTQLMIEIDGKYWNHYICY